MMIMIMNNNNDNDNNDNPNGQLLLTQLAKALLVTGLLGRYLQTIDNSIL